MDSDQKKFKTKGEKKKDFYLACTKEKNLAPLKSPPLPLITFLMVHSFISNYPYFFLSWSQGIEKRKKSYFFAGSLTHQKMSQDMISYLFSKLLSLLSLCKGVRAVKAVRVVWYSFNSSLSKSLKRAISKWGKLFLVGQIMSALWET